MNGNILIAVKSPKVSQDVQKLLISHFVKHDPECKTFFEEKLKFFLVSHKEYVKRDAFVSQRKQCSPPIIEAFLLQKLSLLLEQKNDYYYKKLNAKINLSKKRDRSEMSGGDNMMHHYENGSET